LRRRSSDRPGWDRFFLRQLGYRQVHRAADGDAGNAFVLINPSVRRQLLLAFLVQGLQLFHALFRTGLFVIASAWRGPHYSEHDYAEQRKEEHNPEPRGKWGGRVCNPAKRFGVGHFS
jgi:hypothetical protein